MSKLLQLKGENFLGLGKLKEKIFPITKVEAVLNEDGTTVKDSINNINTSVDNLEEIASKELELYSNGSRETIDVTGTHKFIKFDRDIVELVLKASAEDVSYIPSIFIFKVDSGGGTFVFPNEFGWIYSGTTSIGASYITLTLEAALYYMVTFQCGVVRVEEIKYSE